MLDLKYPQRASSHCGEILIKRVVLSISVPPLCCVLWFSRCVALPSVQAFEYQRHCLLLLQPLLLLLLLLLLLPLRIFRCCCIAGDPPLFTLRTNGTTIILVVALLLLSSSLLLLCIHVSVNIRTVLSLTWNPNDSYLYNNNYTERVLLLSHLDNHRPAAGTYASILPVLPVVLNFFCTWN